MQPIRPNRIDVALLYQDYSPFAYRRLVERLKAVLGNKTNVILGMHQDGSFGVIDVGGVVVKVSQNNAPLSQDGFQGGLSSPFTELAQPDAKKLVAGHKKNIFVTVGDDNILAPNIDLEGMPSELREITADVLGHHKVPTISEFVVWLTVAAIVVNELTRMGRPDLIHWCQSDQFFLPDQIDLSDKQKAMSLQIHPNLFTNGVDEEGRQWIGFHAYGSEHIMGHHVLVKETPFALPKVIRIVNDFIHSLSSGEELPRDGQVVLGSSGASLRVTTKEPDELHPRIYLSVEILDLGNKARNKKGSETDRTGMSKRKPFYQTNTGIVMSLVAIYFLAGFLN